MEEVEDDYDDDKYDAETVNDVNGCLDNDSFENNIDNDTINIDNVGARPRRISQLQTTHHKKPKAIPKASSLFLLSHTNPFRVFCNKIVNHTYFTNSVLVKKIIFHLILNFMQIKILKLK